MGTEVRDTTDRSTANSTWKTLFASGTIIAVIGVLAIFFPFLAGVTLSVLLGAALLVGAALHAVHAFSAGDWKGVLWQVVLAIVYAVAGVALVVNPVFGLVTLTILVIAYLAVIGVVEIVMGIALRPEKNWAWVVASGVISLLLAGLLFGGWPGSAEWALGLLFGVSLLTSGLSMVGVAMGGREAEREMPAGRTERAT
ncbi:HdeD family acid-resistance protein [Haladaptatus caseinilyticus]|uniref:HdeD family acid-resistance protein n=1 Tax=Haladaptatus caseinilyticus TaxID=2993314 RepID=UPI00224B7E95|nr:HdeD family acid-resistance protein [Haladaptatus caseinilyticus]